MNVIFVTIDCLRRDFLDESYAPTPFLDRCRRDGLFFSNMHATATTTTPAVASYFTGHYSETNGVNSLRNVDLDPSLDTLAERFSSAGYHTEAMVTGPLLPETGLNRGFDQYEHRNKDTGVFTDWFDDQLESVENLPEPFFYYLHLWEIHHPITVPSEYDTIEYGDRPYARALSGVDSALQKLYEQVSDETLFVVHGDHGEAISTRESLLAKGAKEVRDYLRYNREIDTRPVERRVNQFRRGHACFPDHYLENGHGEVTHDFTTNVPFLICGPGINKERIDAQVRQIDVYPTLLDLVDIGYDAEAITGETLTISTIEDRDAYTRACGEALRGEENWLRSLRTGDERYIEYANRDWEAELYDLNADPHELDPITDFNPEPYRRRLPTNQLRDTKDIAIDDHLKDLGYL
ncbi:Arylsulfatase A [Halorubrum ezzemoulense]|uniref:Arylsulfatase A n=1 Tax=Halorubrum ezzemoulense TaxID=337243 RepID=A0A238UU77_HALEZ|nr:sulfatase-like hydrolase/transferase [Halorubrum ezzemoulense]MDB2262951.1 sulfatase-like hydrolase/transferase [Halorubrum ezzemoulense]SNR25755.1 Arylsulfatase A [Halorubrum ezzemoulense]